MAAAEKRDSRPKLHDLTLVGTWTSTSEDANNPEYAVHLLFEDREVVIRTSTVGEEEMAFVETFYPSTLSRQNSCSSSPSPVWIANHGTMASRAWEHCPINDPLQSLRNPQHS